ncbi:MAG: Neocarzinostatin family [Actinomycetia bacterium]|nr:Neocarzinostatin family [Actinomycetes bacterium]
MFGGRVRVGRALFAVVLGISLATLGVSASGGIVGKSSTPAPNPTLTVSPNTGLADTQPATVAGTGFTPGSLIVIFECEASAPPSSCGLFPVAETTSDPSGAFSLQPHLRRLVDVVSGHHFTSLDCAVASCVLDAINVEALDESAAAPIAFDPTIPPVVPTITITPNKNLADHQLVTITGKNFQSRDFVQVQQCVKGAKSKRCEYETARFMQTNGAGAFTIKNFVLKRAITTFSNHTLGGTTVDCAHKVGQCVIVANGFDFHPASAPLNFDPNLPPVVPTLTANPSGALKDLQEIVVSGTGFTPGLPVNLQQCTGDPQFPDCDYVNGQQVTPGFHGEFLVTMPVHRFQATFGAAKPSRVDCAKTAGVCSIASFGDLGEVGASTPLTFDKNAAAITPAISATPNTGLADNQRVSVQLSGFAPNRPVQLLECSAKTFQRGALGACDLAALQVTSMPVAGSATTAFDVHRTIAGGNGLTDCSARAGACVLVAVPFPTGGGYGFGGVIGFGPKHTALAKPRNATKTLQAAATNANLLNLAFVPLTFTTAP